MGRFRKSWCNRVSSNISVWKTKEHSCIWPLCPSRCAHGYGWHRHHFRSSQQCPCTSSNTYRVPCWSGYENRSKQWPLNYGIWEQTWEARVQAIPAIHTVRKGYWTEEHFRVTRYLRWVGTLWPGVTNFNILLNFEYSAPLSDHES